MENLNPLIFSRLGTETPVTRVQTDTLVRDIFSLCSHISVFCPDRLTSSYSSTSQYSSVPGTWPRMAFLGLKDRKGQKHFSFTFTKLFTRVHSHAVMCGITLIQPPFISTSAFCRWPSVWRMRSPPGGRNPGRKAQTLRRQRARWPERKKRGRNRKKNNEVFQHRADANGYILFSSSEIEKQDVSSAIREEWSIVISSCINHFKSSGLYPSIFL